MPKENEREAILTRLSPELKKVLDEEAHRRGISVQAFVARAIARELRPAQQAGDQQADAEVVALMEDVCRRVLVEEGLLKEGNPDEDDDGKPRFAVNLHEIIFQGLPKAPNEEERKKEEARRAKAKARK